jgi:hypothetical protein
MNAEVEYAIGRFMRVRKLSGTYQINDSWLVGGARHKRRRYKLYPVKGSGAILDVTEAFADDMDPLPEAKPLELVPDEQPITHDAHGPLYKRDLDADALRDGRLQRIAAPQEPDAPAGHAEPAPVAAQPVADAIRSPDGLEPGAFGGELDEYSVGARYPEEPGELKNPYKPIRKHPENPTYQDLKCIVYNARFKGLEKLGTNQLAQLEEGTPIAVAVTHETNGHAIWVITTEAADEIRRARLEVFYPHAQGSSADAIEYAVLLALRQVPIRTEDLEILLLELA